MGSIAPQITSLAIVYSIVYSDADQSKHQSSASLAFVRVIHRGPVNSPHKWPVTRKMFPFDDVIVALLPTEVKPLHEPMLIRDGVSNHRRLDCLLNSLFRRKLKKNLRHWLLWGDSTSDRWIPLTNDQFPFDDVIMFYGTVPGIIP